MLCIANFVTDFAIRFMLKHSIYVIPALCPREGDKS
jgi:hypothetical protein